VAELADVFYRLLVPHPPKNFFFNGVIGKHFNIGCGPASAANNGNFLYLLKHYTYNVLQPGNWFSPAVQINEKKATGKRVG
jgi:hypothetical protein